MKPLLLLLFSIIWVHLCNAQNYACIQRNEQRYFINEDGYLRGIRVDAYEASGADTVLHPFKTDRFMPGAGLSDSDASWMGRNVTQQADGVFIFPTIWFRNVVLKTQALPGDSWTFYSEASPRSYKATVTAMDTMTVLGTLDSIKTIRIAAYMDTTINPADSINGYEMIISKEHGFVKTFDLYLFPYRTAGGTPVYDFYQDRIGSIGKRKMTFVLTAFQVPTKMEVYDFNEGDVFVTWGHSDREFPEVEWLTYDSIVSKTFPDPWHVQYQIFRKNKSTESYYPWGGPSVVHHYYNASTLTVQFDTSKLFSMPYMPEEMPTMPRVWHYRPEDSGYCFKSASYKMEDVVVFEGGPNYFEYKTGFEQISSGTHIAPLWVNDVGYHSARWSNMVFSVKNGVPCGVRQQPNNVRELNVQGEPLSVYPNPATNELHIGGTVSLTDVSITDITGRRVYDATRLPADAIVSVGNLAPGLYILRANGMVQKFVKQ